VMAGALLGYAEEMKRATNATRRSALAQAHGGVVLGRTRGEDALAGGPPRTLL
jgi:hypothetical protein